MARAYILNPGAGSPRRSSALAALRMLCGLPGCRPFSCSSECPASWGSQFHQSSLKDCFQPYSPLSICLLLVCQILIFMTDNVCVCVTISNTRVRSSCHVSFVLSYPKVPSPASYPHRSSIPSWTYKICNYSVCCLMIKVKRVTQNSNIIEICQK